MPQLVYEKASVQTDGNLYGISAMISFASEGYEIDSFTYSSINDLLHSSKDIIDSANNVISGKRDSRDIRSTLKTAIYSAGQVCGIPFRNVRNFTNGIMSKFFPTEAYKMNDKVYKQNYRADLEKAIEREDEKMIATIVGLMLDENVGEIEDSTSRRALDSLVVAGYDVIPKTVNDRITFGGEEYDLTAKEVKQFEKIYFEANDRLASLVKLSQFKEATDEEKAKAVKFIYNVYYNLAIEDFLGEDVEAKNTLFAKVIDIEKLAIIVATANSITADLDKNGKTISGTKKAKIQAYVNSLKLSAAEKYLIMGYLGYKNLNGERQVKAHLRALNLTSEEREQLLSYGGYAV